MITEVCQYLRNWFERDIIPGHFKVENGSLTYADGSALPLVADQYYRICGSLFNDGVHKFGDQEDVLKDEAEFAGTVWSMAVPPAVLALVDEMADWMSKNQDAVNSPYQSESFGGYSYSMRSGYSQSNGESSGITWQNQFGARLAPWRKI